ncbi:BadF/BadG/BcrA/BcrD ATPase family protein [Paenibacillus apiarius]|uniref:BadF/BadG/BcrA/BcrD ATPase family protein n=1 Tax=Paenibacillus apiarius TaxID=46240 RepID=UPI003B3BD75A
MKRENGIIIDVGNKEKNIVIGIEGGGTKTRAMAARLNGSIIGYAETGCSNPNKDERARENVREVMEKVLEAAGARPDEVVGLCTGLSGLESEQDLTWAAEFTDVPGISCPKRHVNDSTVAHAGAFIGEPGIIAISGTGSVVFGINEYGRLLRNQDYNHYAGAARHLSYECVHRIIAGCAERGDGSLLEEVLAFWGVSSVGQLHELGAGGFAKSVHEQMRLFGQMAPMVTRAAAEGSPLAAGVCMQLVQALDLGVRLIGAGFEADNVQVAFMGSVIRDPFVSHLLTELLQRNGGGAKRYRIIEPRLSPPAGAVLLALRECGAPADEQVLARLAME